MSSRPIFCDPNMPGLDLRRVTHFSEVLYYIVDDRSTDSIISWGQNGKSFVVWNLDKFCSDVLPKFSIQSHHLHVFILKLQAFGFQKVEESEQWEYARDQHFVRGKPELTHEIEKTAWVPRLPQSMVDLVKYPLVTFMDQKDPGFLAKKAAFLKAMAERKAAREIEKRTSKLTIS